MVNLLEVKKKILFFTSQSALNVLTLSIKMIVKYRKYAKFSWLSSFTRNYKPEKLQTYHKYIEYFIGHSTQI